MDTHKIAEKARKSISRFCIEECAAFCCRKGYLVLKPAELDIVTQGFCKHLESKGILTKTTTGNWSLNMGGVEGGCPSLKYNMCSIHRRHKRPDTCKQFPLFIQGNTIMLSQRCLAVRQGLLYPYISMLIRMGYKVIDGSTHADSDFYKILPDPKDPLHEHKDPEKDNTVTITA